MPAVSRRPAIITQADVARAIRAAKQAGAGLVEVRPDGTILIHPEPVPVKTVEPSRDIVL